MFKNKNKQLTIDNEGGEQKKGRSQIWYVLGTGALDPKRCVESGSVKFHSHRDT